MNRNDIRQRLIDGTIRVIAEGGLDKASTKQIGLTTGVNEAYIYRCFADKDDLFVQTFHFLDDELIGKILENLPVMYVSDVDWDVRCRMFFESVWNFILGGKEKCLAFIRLYYSPYYKKYAYDEHRAKYQPVIDKFQPAFIEEANVRMIFNHILTTMLVFAVNVFDGAIPADEDTAEHVFRVIHASVRQYFKERA